MTWHLFDTTENLTAKLSFHRCRAAQLRTQICAMTTAPANDHYLLKELSVQIERAVEIKQELEMRSTRK